MANDKNKIIEAATKYIQKGQYDKAIREYNKLLEADPRDIRIQQKLGELYQKKGDTLLAADSFLKVAESYAADGFFLKAVAVYKQALRLNPSMVEVNIKLAELHQQLGLMSDAMAQYQIVANYYEKSGNTKASLDALRKMVDLDPDNVASRIKLAEIFIRIHSDADAITELRTAASYLKRNNRADEYLKVLERLSSLLPDDLDLASELAPIYLSRQDAKRALAKLQVCFKSNPKDVNTLNLLVQAFISLELPTKAISVLKELAAIYSGQKREDLVQATWAKVLDINPEDTDGQAAINSLTRKHLDTTSSAVPSSVSRSRTQEQSPPSMPAESNDEHLRKLLTETDVYSKYGLHQKAIAHLTKAMALAPESIAVHEKAALLHLATGNPEARCEALAEAVRLAISNGEMERARLNFMALRAQNSEHPKINQFLSIVGNELVKEEITEVDDDAIIIDDDDSSVIVAVHEDLGLKSAALVAGERDEEVVSESNLDDSMALDAAASISDYQIESRPGMDNETPDSEIINEPVASSVDQELDQLASEELDEAEFFLQQGMRDEAWELVQNILLAYPKSSRAINLLAQMEDTPSSTSPLASELSSSEVAESIQSDEPLFDLEKELSSEELVELDAASAIQDFQYSVEDVFGEFKKGLKNVVKPEDVDTHYDLGIAYKEMGLLDDAYSEFEQAATSAMGLKKEFDCLSMMGVCCVESDHLLEAIEIYKRCLTLPQVTPEMAKSVHYELGMVYEKLDLPDEAVRQWLEVQMVDPNYRNVSAVIERIQEVKAPPGSLIGRKPRKVGYV